MTKVMTTTAVDIDLDIPTAAQWFCALSDDEMAKFFCACANEMERQGGWGESMMWHTGHHLAKCECSTKGGRDMIRSIMRGMEYCRD